MTDFSPTRLGQKNGTGGVQELFDDVLVKEMIYSTFARNLKFLDKVRKRVISSGKGATFPHIGQIDGRFHIPGTEITDGDVDKSETFIPVDQMVIAHTWMANQDEWMSEVDYRMDIAREIGLGLQRSIDRMIAYKMALSARSASDLTERGGGFTGGQDESDGAHSLGGTVTDRLRASNAATDASTLYTLISNAVQIMDEQDIPEEDRYVALRPAQNMLLLNAGLISMDRDFGGEGSAALKRMPWCAGARVIVSNHVPNTGAGGPAAGTAGVPVNDSNGLFGDGTNNTSASGGGDYSGDNADSDPTLGFSKTVALVFQKQAMASVVLRDVDMEAEYSVRHQAHLMLGRYMMGHKALRPECVCEITSSNA